MTFVFVSGDLALDFAGTLKWRREAPEELLVAPADAAQWAVEAGILTAGPEITPDELVHLRHVRETIYRLAVATLSGERWRKADLDAINELANGPLPAYTLSATGLARTGNAAVIACVAARAAAELLADSGNLVLRECGRQLCTRLFIDRSRTVNRRWCGMEECGNRVKAAQYRARKSAG